jgi:vitamin B12 transporter
MKSFYLLISLFLGVNIWAQNLDSIQSLDEVLITSTKYPIAKKYSGKIIAKITSDELAQNPSKTVAQLLDEISGMEINGAKSTAGKNQAAYIQGGKAGQVLVIIDGMPVIDPSGIDMAYDLNLLSAGQIESIEVMQGAAGTLYGSGAATAVINIKTLACTHRNLAIELGTTLSSQRTQKDDFLQGKQWNQSVLLNGKYNRFNYLVSYNGNSANGFTEAYDNGTHFKDNPFEKQQVLAKFGMQFSEQFKLQMIGNYTHLYHQFDQDAYTDSEVNKTDTQEFKLGLQATWKHAKGNLQWFSELKNTDRQYRQFNAWSNALEDFQYVSQSLQSDVFHLYQWSEKVDVLTGLNFQFHQTDQTTPYGNIDSKTGQFYSADPYVNLNFKDVYGFNLSLGSRLNLHNLYGYHATFSINPSYVFDLKDNQHIKVLGSWSSAYLVPSIYQLHSAYGNTDLEPETTETLELGFDYQVSKLVNLQALYFERSESNAIIFETNTETWVSQYQNDEHGVIYVSGVETGFQIAPFDKWQLHTNYTYTKTSKERPYSIPKHKWNAKLQYKALKNTAVQMRYQYTSDRTQLDFTTYPYQQKQLAHFHLMGLSLTQGFNQDKWSLNLAIDNLFNTDYVETIGYSTMGRNFALSVHYKI